MSSTDSKSNGAPQLSPLKQALLALDDMQARLSADERRRSEPIAIIGMGCRFPGANDPSNFWRLLSEGREAIREVPESRWKIEDYYDANPDVPGKMSTRWGGFLDSVDQFDPEFFGISPREAVSMDPQQRLLLEVAWEALENAGQAPQDLGACRTGIFVGLTSDEYAQLFYRNADLSCFNAYFASGVARSVAGGRISYVLGVEGPNMSIDTACSSSLVGVHTACLHLRMQECRMALAGGVTVILAPEVGIAFSKAHMMAPDGRCKAFDSRADGFVRAEGCGMVVLKRLSDAVADGDQILALIRGSAVNQDGRSSGITAPNGKSQENLIRTALAQAGARPEEIGYVEAHGTGTSLGDPIEAHALATVLGPGRDKKNPLIIGSVKTNIGHLEAAAGIAGLIKTVLALRHEYIPPHLHFQRMNPHIDWGGNPVEIPVQGRPWPRSNRRRLAGVSSFGFSGTNAHIILEEAPPPERRQGVCERPVQLLALSARSESALCDLGGRYADILETPQDYPLVDLCFTANAGRTHFEQRLAVVGSSPEQLRAALRKALPGRRVHVREGLRPVFLFPGQGAQFPGMGKQLYDTQPVFRDALDQCAKLLISELEKPLLEVLWGGATELLDQTAYTQPGLFAVEYALATLWCSWGIEPAAVVGHSVGEYVAACVAGVYSLADGLKLIARRARLMQGISGLGAMAAVSAPEDRVREALRGLEQRVAIAAINSPENMVISGYEQELQTVEQRLRETGSSVQRLKVSHAFHSPQMRQMEDAFESVAREVVFHPPRLTVISSVTGQAVAAGEMSRPTYWRYQVNQPVRFRRAMETLRERGDTVFLEVGPGTTLSALGQACIGDAQQMWLTSFRRNREEWPQILDSLGQMYMWGADVNWAAFDKPYARRRVSLPTYPFERQRYWIETQPVGRHANPTPKDIQPQTSAISSVTPAAEALEEWFCRIGWQELDFRVTTAGSPCLQWILLADSNGVAEALASRIRHEGCTCILIRGSHRELGQILTEAESPKTGIVDLRYLDAKEAAEACLVFANLIQEVARIYRPGIFVWSVTQGAQAIGTSSAFLPWLAPVWALGRTAISEYSEFWGGMVDLDPNAAPAENADLLWRHLAGWNGEDQSAFREGRRLVARLQRESAPPAKDPAFRGDAAYLITGGSGALGLETARWMARLGARRIILLGRTPLPPRREWGMSGSKDPHHAAISTILELERLGVSVQTAAVDVGDADGVQRFFQCYKEECWPPIRGVVHAAGASRRALITEASAEDFRIAFRAKVDGTWLLHQALEGAPLDFFVLFSSASAVLSSPRVGAYAASNAFLDAVAEYRSSRGLPGLSVNWGEWTGVGMAASTEPSAARTQAENGAGGMKIEEGFACLGRLLGTAGQVCVLPIDWQKWGKLYPAYMAKPFFSNLMGESLKGLTPARPAPAGQGLLDRMKDAPESSRLNIVQEFLQTLAVRVLGFPRDRRIDPLQPLNELGLDSLMALEFRNALSAEVCQPLPATLLFNYPALEDVTSYLAKMLFGSQKEAVGAPAGKKRAALDDIEELSDEEVSRLLAAKLGTHSKLGTH